MFEISTARSRPMLYIVTSASDRSSSISSTIKTSLEQVRQFILERGVVADGEPIAVLTYWTGRLVTIEAGFPIESPIPSLQDTRVQAGRTPGGLAASVDVGESSIDHSSLHQRLAADLRAAGHLLTGVAWEAYAPEPSGGLVVTRLFAQLLTRPGTALSTPIDLDQG
jgi:hypothetical protein